MPLDLTIDETHGIIMMHGSGVLTDSDLVQARSQCDTIPVAGRLFPRLCDLSDITDVSVSTEALTRWTTDPVSNPPVPHAMICSAPPVLKRVLDFVVLSRKGFRQISLFPTYDKAMDWIRKEQEQEAAGRGF